MKTSSNQLLLIINRTYQSILKLDNLKKKLYPWYVLFLGSGFLFYKYLLQVSPTIMVTELMRSFQLTGEAMGHLAACYFYAYLLMQLPGGLLLDRINLRYILSVAITICALGGFIFSIATTFWMAALGRLLVGFGGAFSAIGTMKLISMWFKPNYFSFCSGLMMTAGMLGAVGGQAPLAFLTNSYGWQKTLLLISIVGISYSSLVFITLKAKPMTSTKPRVALGWRQIITHLKRLLKDKQSWLISCYSGLAFAPISAFGGLWGVPFLQTKLHISNTHAAGLVSLIFIGFAIGCPLAGVVSQILQKRKPLMYIGTVLGMLSLSGILLMAINNILLISIMLFSFGFFTSFFFLSFAVIREINPIMLGGTAIGFINMFDALFGALSEPVTGRLLDLFWDKHLEAGNRVFSLVTYQNSLSILIVAMICSLLLLWFVKETHCHQSKSGN